MPSKPPEPRPPAGTHDPSPLPLAHEVRLPSVDGLRAFEAAARLGTFERAADELAVTASAVAKRVAALEALIGTALFVRTGKTLQPTAAGREYLPPVAEVLAQLAALPWHQRRQQRLERLKVSTPPTFARQVLVPVLDGFGQAYPAVELEVMLSVPYLETGPGDADVAVRMAEPARHPEARLLLDDRLVPMAAPALLQRLPPLRQPADLAAVPLLRTPLDPWQPWFAAMGLRWPEPNRGPRLLDLGLTLEAAAAGQGVALARPSLARPWLLDGRLRPLFETPVRPVTQYLALTRPGAGAAARAFVDWLAGQCREAARAGEAALEAAFDAARGRPPTPR